MNSAIGLNVQKAPLVEVSQEISVKAVSATHSCQDSDCAEDDGGFFELLNTELNALVDSEPQGSEVVGDHILVENIEITNSMLSDLLQNEDNPSELLSLVQPVLMDSEIQNFEQELNDELGVIQQNNVELITKIKQGNGQGLSLDGKKLPLFDETLVKQDSQIASLNANGINQNMFGKELNNNGQAKNMSLDLLVKSELESDSNLKNVFEKNDTNVDAVKDKTLIENMLSKISAQSDSVAQKTNTQALVTSFNNALGTNQASINTPTAAAVQSGSTLLLPQNPSPEQWGSALGDKVQWMVNTKLESAEIRIDPPHLGKLDISIKMTDDGANVVIQTQHAATRELIDAASYRLKEMLEQAGHENVNVDVSHQESKQSEKQMAENDDQDAQRISNNNDDNQDALTASTNDILAGTFNERPSLDLFA